MCLGQGSRGAGAVRPWDPVNRSRSRAGAGAASLGLWAEPRGLLGCVPCAIGKINTL